ncbi:hypothetical protein BDV19DRAFT_393688 [Aspergillus venezuelensis]
MRIFASLLGFSLLLCPVQCAFNLFPGRERTFTQRKYGLSDACCEALNETVLCENSTAGKVATGPDNYRWTEEELTSLCTKECNDSLPSWKKAVTKDCGSNRVAESFSTSWVGGQRYSEDTCYIANEADNPPECDDPDFSTSLITPDMKDVTNLYDLGLPLPEICNGQLILPSDAREVFFTCREIANAYNVSTRTLEHIAGSWMCDFDQPICLPPPCEIELFYGNPSCEELAARYSTPERPISLVQFLAWNPHIEGRCDFLNHVQWAAGWLLSAY